MVTSLDTSPDEADPYQVRTTGREGGFVAWLMLITAGLLEVVWSLGLKYTQGFTRLGPSVITGAAIVGSMYLLSRAARTLPIGTAYAVWVGVGVVGAALGGMVLFDEAMPPLRALFLVLLVISIAGLMLTSAPG
jgi:quaternary ammonium compound-resistance protein SugE